MQTPTLHAPKLMMLVGLLAKGRLDRTHGHRAGAKLFVPSRTWLVSASRRVVSLVLRAMELTAKGVSMSISLPLPKLLLISIAMACQPGFAQASASQAASSSNMSVEKTVREYYAAFEKKDWNLMEQILADGFTFTSPLDDHISVDRFRERCWPNAYKIKRIDVDKLVVNGDQAVVITNGWTTDGKLFRNSDYFKLTNGKIREYECFFGPGINYPSSGK